MARVIYLHDPAFHVHDPGPGHPERRERLRSIESRLETDGLFDRLIRHPARPATREELLSVHAPAHVDRILALDDATRSILDAGDTRLGPGSVDAALRAAGAAIEAADRVLDGDVDAAFVPARPPGHHATADRPLGFCVFNNAALCAARALRRPEVERVLIVDWDVHHGNGTQDIFYDSGAVFFLSLHQSPLFPFSGREEETGRGAGRGFTRNVPLRPGADDALYTDLLDRALAEIESEFAPQLVVISAGFDAHADDPIGGMMLSEDGFRAMTRSVTALARRSAGGRVVSCLEGGYHLEALARSTSAHLEALLEG